MPTVKQEVKFWTFCQNLTFTDFAKIKLQNIKIYKVAINDGTVVEQ
jgi:hypothetical protein